MTVSVDAAESQADVDAQTNVDAHNAAGPQADVNAWADMDAKTGTGQQAEGDEQRTPGA